MGINTTTTYRVTCDDVQAWYDATDDTPNGARWTKFCHLATDEYRSVEDARAAAGRAGWNLTYEAHDQVWHLCPSCATQIKKRDHEQTPPEANAVYHNSNNTYELVELDEIDTVYQVIKPITEHEAMSILAGENHYTPYGRWISVGDGDHFHRITTDADATTHEHENLNQ